MASWVAGVGNHLAQPEKARGAVLPGHTKEEQRIAVDSIKLTIVVSLETEEIKWDSSRVCEISSLSWWFYIWPSSPHSTPPLHPLYTVLRRVRRLCAIKIICTQNTYKRTPRHAQCPIQCPGMHNALSPGPSGAVMKKSSRNIERKGLVSTQHRS